MSFLPQSNTKKFACRTGSKSPLESARDNRQGEVYQNDRACPENVGEERWGDGTRSTTALAPARLGAQRRRDVGAGNRDSRRAGGWLARDERAATTPALRSHQPESRVGAGPCCDASAEQTATS